VNRRQVRAGILSRVTDGLLARLAEEFADEVTGRYRIERAAAVELILASWARRPRLVAAAERAGSVEEVRRLRVYRDAATGAKREVYQRLRRYRPAPPAADAALAALLSLTAGAAPAERARCLAAVAAGHASTAERLDHLDAFLATLTGWLGRATSVVDVGCGVLPLLFPFDGAGAAVGQWWALDRDAQAYAALSAYARLRGDGRLRPVHWDAAEGWGALPDRFDVGLLLKVVPVVARTDPRLLRTLAAVPADRLVVSGCRTALAKRRDIERREAAALARFFGGYGFTVVDRRRTPDEICFLVERDPKYTPASANRPDGYWKSPP
jgi:16S rRNA (guanine(1405)-N(7))-methyltransferase